MGVGPEAPGLPKAMSAPVKADFHPPVTKITAPLESDQQVSG